MGPESPFGLLKSVPRGGYKGADCIEISGFDRPAEDSIVILGGALARFVLRAFVDNVLGVRLPVAGVTGCGGIFLLDWLLRWSINASC